MLVTSRSPLHVSGERDIGWSRSRRATPPLFVERARAFGRELCPIRPSRRSAAAWTGFRSRSSLPRRARSSSLPSGSSSGSARLSRCSRAARATRTSASARCARRSSGATTSSRLRIRSSWSGSRSSRELPAQGCGGGLRRRSRRLAALVDSSLLKPIGDDRFLMLETIREYALERLESSDEAEALRQRHATFFSALAEQAYEHRFDAEAEWSERLESTTTTFGLLSTGWLTNDPGPRARAGGRARLVLVFPRLSRQRGDDDSPSARGVGGDRSSRARALTAAGSAARAWRRRRRRSSAARRGDRAWRDLGDRDELASALDALGWLLVYDAGDAPGALHAFEQSLELRRQLGDRPARPRARRGVPGARRPWGGRASGVALQRPARRETATRGPSTSPSTSSLTAR